MSEKEGAPTNSENEMKGSTPGVAISLTAPAKTALKLPPLQQTPAKGAKAGAKELQAKDSPAAKVAEPNFSLAESKMPLPDLAAGDKAQVKSSSPTPNRSPRPSPAVQASVEQAPPVVQAPIVQTPVVQAPVVQTPMVSSAPAEDSATKSPTEQPVSAEPKKHAHATNPATPKTPAPVATGSPAVSSIKKIAPKTPTSHGAGQSVPFSNPQSPAVPSSSKKEALSASAKETGSSKKHKEGTPNKDAERSKEFLRFKASVEYFAEHPVFTGLMAVLTIWALYNSDIQFAATDKEADTAFEVIISIAFFLFIMEIGMSCLYKPDYWCEPKWEAEELEEPYETWYRRLTGWGSFYFWLDWIATLSLIFEMEWMLGPAYEAVNGGTTLNAAAGDSSQAGARASRVVRLVRMVRLVRLIKLYKYSAIKRKPEETDNEVEEAPAESRVGAAMSDLTNRRVIVLILLMLIVIPQLTVNDVDISLPLGVQFVHALAKLNASDSTYSSGLNLAIETVQNELPLIYMNLNGVVVYDDSDRYDALRPSERATYELNNDGFLTRMSYDQKDVSVQNALFSIYTTSFIIVLLIGGTYFFLSDVNRLVIGPIERLVDLVRKISANPLGVEYKVLGAEEGFLEGLETTVLLTTITKIGALMRVGFGEAGASVIAKNLAESSGGRLNLMGAGTMIRSIFGFCDVRQFTDTTECLQEEVMLFVNRIAHILHSIVVQCSGAANKNIGDAFLLTWKLDEKLTEAQVASLADQALLAFCKSLIELSRYQEFIVNFSMAATARLYKRFPEYNVRIGSGLHVGWAIEGAIGSHRKIDASYLSPHVNNTEYLESSTKAYGVPLLLSEPFFRLLSPAASRYCRQVDRIRRSEFEEPMGLFTYDSDLDIDWNDMGRHLKFNFKAKLMQKAREARTKNAIAMLKEAEAAKLLAAQEHIPIGNHVPHHSAIALGAAAPALNRNRRGSALSRLVGLAPPAPVEEPINEEKKADLAEIEARVQRAKQTPTVVVPKYNEDVWVKDQDIIDLRHRVSDSFRAQWENGINAYIKGDWKRAKEVFVETMRLSKKKDGPSKFLLEIISEHGGSAPADWPGYRADY